MNDAPLVTEPRRRALERMGYTQVPEPVVAMETAVRRGHHLALVAGEGSGKEALYGILAGERCDPGSYELQALCLVATPEGAAELAAAAYVLNPGAGLDTLAGTPGARRRSAAGHPAAHLVAGRPEEILEDVRAGRLSLGGLRLLVVDGVEALRRTGGWEAAEALLDTAVGEVQKAAATDRLDDAFLELVEHRLPRARRWPPELFPVGAPEEGREEPDPVPLWLATGATDRERAGALARGLRRLAGGEGTEGPGGGTAGVSGGRPEEAESTEEGEPTGRVAVLCPDEAVAHRVAGALAAEGLRIAEGAEAPGVEVVWGSDIEPPGAVAALYGLPPALDPVRRWLEPAAGRLAVVAPSHLAQAEILARRLGWRTRPLPGPVASDGIDRFRREVRAEVEAAEPGPELLLLEPLLEELGTAAVAAALARMVRALRSPGPAGREPTTPSPEGEERRGAPRLPERGLRPAWTRIFVNVGKRDGAGPGDLVGAITGETSAAGAQVGKVDVRPTYSLVDVDSQIVETVLRELEGVRIRGREVTARLDRGG